MSGPRVEILYFAGCPNAEPARALVERLSRELGLEADIELVAVPDLTAAKRLRFPGSPTVRVEGRDVDPHAADGAEYGLGCRLYRTAAGPRGLPEERRVRETLLGAGDDARPRFTDA